MRARAYGCNSDRESISFSFPSAGIAFLRHGGDYAHMNAKCTFEMRRVAHFDDRHRLMCARFYRNALASG